MRILVDEDLQAKSLVRMLRDSGHDVTTAAEACLDGHDDRTVLALAHREGRVLLTRNARDFREMHDSGAPHSSILAVYRERNRRQEFELP